jgi:hypothetical protein
LKIHNKDIKIAKDEEFATHLKEKIRKTTKKLNDKENE